MIAVESAASSIRPADRDTYTDTTVKDHHEPRSQRHQESSDRSPHFRSDDTPLQEPRVMGSRSKTWRERRDSNPRPPA